MEKRYIRYCAVALAVILVVLLVYAVFKQLEEYQLQDDPKLRELEDIFSKFFNKERYWNGHLSVLNKKNVMKDTTLYRGNKSYTINKEKIFLCLKDEKGEYYDLNMLIYVLAHEYSHAICNSVGHTEEFHKIFENLLLELTDAGIYDPTQKILVDYCQHGGD